MKALIKVLRFLISYFVSFAALYLSGYGDLMENVEPGTAARIFLLNNRNI